MANLDLRPAEGHLTVMRQDLADLAEKISQLYGFTYDKRAIHQEVAAVGLDVGDWVGPVARASYHHLRAFKLIKQAEEEMEAAVKEQARVVDAVTEARTRAGRR